MSDRHLYKGKRIDNGEWVEGKSLESNFSTFVVTMVNTTIDTRAESEQERIWSLEYFKVDPSTLCQCTGYKGIWEHDIFQCDEDRYQIVFDEERLTWQAEAIFSSESIELGEFCPEEIDVIGNIFDNPELLEGGAG